MKMTRASPSMRTAKPQEDCEGSFPMSCGKKIPFYGDLPTFQFFVELI